MKVLVLYYSGVGNTRMVAGKLFELLERAHRAVIASVEKLPADVRLEEYDGLVIGFPTIHAAPARPMAAFLERLEKLKRPVPAFLFTTCGLYSANALRIFAKLCLQKNIVPILNRSYRCAAVDGILFAPGMRVWYRHEKRLDTKVEFDAGVFPGLCVGPVTARIPRFKLYSIFNYPNKLAGQRFSPKIYLHEANCVLCGKCMLNCPAQAIGRGGDGYPLLGREKCIHCYRCIHHCPGMALSLSKKRPPLKTLYRD